MLANRLEVYAGIVGFSVGLSLAATGQGAVVMDLIQAERAIQGKGDSLAEIKFKFDNFDNGAIYNNPLIPSPQSGELNVNSEELFSATGRIGNEDGWGTFDVTTIEVGGVDIDFRNQTGHELTGIFWGIVDTYIQQGIGTSQLIQSNTFNIAFWEDETPDFEANVDSGATRAGFDSFPTATDGTLVLQGSGEAGHLNLDNATGGSPAVFQTNFDSVSLRGSGNAVVSFTDGTWLNDFNTDQFQDVIPDGFAANPADMRIDFTTRPNPDPQIVGDVSIGDWLVRSDDPARTFAVPTPATAWVWGWLSLMGLLGVGRKAARLNSVPA